MNTNTSRSRQNLWFPVFLERMACCAMPPQNINDVVLVGDSQEGDSDVTGGDSLNEDVVVLESNTRQPLSQQLRRELLGSSAGTKHPLPSPTVSPSRRELDRWDPSCSGVTSWCNPSCAGSTATTASTMSDEGEYYGCYDPDVTEEIRSNATTQVVSHKQNRHHRRNELLQSTLASAEQRLRQQLLEEEARSDYLKARRQRKGAR